MPLTYTLLTPEQIPLIDPVRLEGNYGHVQLQPQLLDDASQPTANAIAGTTGVIYSVLLDEVWQAPQNERYHGYLGALPTIDDPVIYEPPSPI